MLSAWKTTVSPERFAINIGSKHPQNHRKAEKGEQIDAKDIGFIVTFIIKQLKVDGGDIKNGVIPEIRSNKSRRDNIVFEMRMILI
jgi:hypothetical protein